jgi:acyl-CoA dehydrogenase
MEAAKQKARENGLWNFFLPGSESMEGLTNLDYTYVANELGKNGLSSQTMNCSAPDTGNMEVLERVGTEEQKEQWLKPLLNGEIRSAFAMTEPALPSSVAKNISTQAVLEGDEGVINGEKYYISGAGDPRCKVMITMVKTSPDAAPHRQQSQILVPIDTPGVHVLEGMEVFGHDDAPHGHMHIHFDNVRVPKENILLGEGRGFEISQVRLGPGRIHHCMRWIGMCERSFDLMCKRAVSRELAHGQLLADKQTIQNWIAECRAEINAARLMIKDAAHKIDSQGVYKNRNEISIIKFYCANVLQKVVDYAIQVHGALGVTDDTILASYYRHERAARIYDGADEVHKSRVARQILKKYRDV